MLLFEVLYAVKAWSKHGAYMGERSGLSGLYPEQLITRNGPDEENDDLPAKKVAASDVTTDRSINWLRGTY